MSRTLTKLATAPIQQLLDVLASPSSSPESYQKAMFDLGIEHGKALSSKLKGRKVGVACTVEDADFLAKGIIEALQNSVLSCSLTCFWNKRFPGDESKNIPDTAPIQKKYSEPGMQDIDALIVAKSIISGACVVKTNLTNLIYSSKPKEIYIVAPVMFYQAQSSLAKEFSSDISTHFKYETFAIDDTKGSDGNVSPGIGGSVYHRLGFKNQDDKNRHTPNLVATRRRNLASA